MSKRTIFLTLLASLPLAACDEKPRRTAGSTATVPSTQSPILTQYQSLWDSLDRTKLEPVLYLFPNRPGLEFDDEAPAAAHDQLIQNLTTLQPTIQKLIDLSKQDPGQFPPRVESSDPDAHMRHPVAWFQNFARMLNADAGRCWEAGDFDAAAARTAAAIRLGTALQNQKENFGRMLSATVAHQGLIKTIAMADQKLLDKMSKPARDDLKSAIDTIKRGSKPEFKQIYDALKPDLDRLNARLREPR